MTLYRVSTDSSRRIAAHAVMQAPDGHAVSIKPWTRSLDQNSKLHALFADIAKTTKYLNRTLTAQQWKTLFISGHAIATGLGADMIPGLENEYVNVRESSAQMSVERMSSLIEYVTCWAAQNQVDAEVSNV